MSIPLVIATETGRSERRLRRFTFSASGRTCPDWKWGHDASASVGITEDARAPHGDNWPHDDPGWPRACERCGYEFADDDQWQRNDCRIIALPDGTEFTWYGSFGACAPPGAMIRAAWYDEHSTHPDSTEPWMISLPGGAEWWTAQPARDGGWWTVTGTPPMITVTPSIQVGRDGGWHGFIREGMLVDA